MRVLLIGNDESARRTLRRVLESEGFATSDCTPRELESLESFPYDCLVIGNSVPEETAQGIAADIRLTGSDAYLVRVSVFENPHSAFSQFVPAHDPEALVITLKHLASVRWKSRLEDIRDTLQDPTLDPDTRAALLVLEAEIEEILKLRNPPGASAAD